MLYRILTRILTRITWTRINGMGSGVMGERASLLEFFAANTAFESPLSRMQSSVLHQMVLAFERIRAHLRE